jgi:hypothetical protein
MHNYTTPNSAGFPGSRTRDVRTCSEDLWRACVTLVTAFLAQPQQHRQQSRREAVTVCGSTCGHALALQDSISRGRRGFPALHFGPERFWVGVGVRQLDALALPIRAATGIPIVVGVDLAAFLLADNHLLNALRPRHAGFSSSCQVQPGWRNPDAIHAELYHAKLRWISRFSHKRCAYMLRRPVGQRDSRRGGLRHARDSFSRSAPATPPT